MENAQLQSKSPVEISRLDLDGSSTSKEAIITDVKHLASYNWIEAPVPTIAVPGSPAQWSPPEGPRQPSFDLDSVDAVTDRNNIRKLLSFVNPSLAKRALEPFTIQVEMAAHTAIFCRDETAAYEVIKPGDFRGFGHEFEKAYTISHVNNSTGHHRIISYQLGGLHFVVRHETDGFVGDMAETEGTLTNIMDSLTISLKIIPKENHTSLSKLTIKRDGRAVPREKTLEIKTRVIHKPLNLQEVASQLWVSQTPNLVRAYHQRGRFCNPEVEDVTSPLKDWERARRKDITQLVALINRIISITESCGGSTTIRYNPLTDKLVIEKVERKKMLPDDLYARWTKYDGVTKVMSQKISGAVNELSGEINVPSKIKSKQ